MQHIGRAGHHAADQTHELRIGLDDRAQLVDLARAVDVPQVHAEVVQIGDGDKDAHDAVVRRAPRLGRVRAAAARIDARGEHGVGRAAGAAAHEQLRVAAPRVGRVERVWAQVRRAKGERVRERRVRGSVVAGVAMSVVSVRAGVLVRTAASVRRAEIGACEVEYGEQQAVQDDEVARVRSGEALWRGKLEQRGKDTHEG